MRVIKTKYLDGNIVELTIKSKEQYRSLATVLKRFTDANYTILITTEQSFADFQRDFGKYCSKQNKSFEDDDTAYELVGKMTLDYYIPNTYFVKSHFDKQVYEIRKADVNVEDKETV